MLFSTMLPLGFEAPSVSASLSDLRSIARLAALRTARVAPRATSRPTYRENRDRHVPMPPEKASFILGSFLDRSGQRLVQQIGDIDLA